MWRALTSDPACTDSASDRVSGLLCQAPNSFSAKSGLSTGQARNEGEAHLIQPRPTHLRIYCKSPEWIRTRAVSCNPWVVQFPPLSRVCRLSSRR
jgi:hypothetical protein